MELEDDLFEDASEKLFSQWGRGRLNMNSNDGKVDNFVGPSNVKSSWRSRYTEDSDNLDSWRTRNGNSSSRKWKLSDLPCSLINKTDQSAKNEEFSTTRDKEDFSDALSNLFKIINLEDHSKSNNSNSKIHSSQSSWRRKRLVLRNDNEDNKSDDESPLRYRNKRLDVNQNKESYRDKGKTGQIISGRKFDSPRRPTVNITLSLREILKLETEEAPENVILALLDKIEAFKKIIGGSLSFEEVVLLMRVFDKICSSHFDENRGKLIISIVNGKFLDKISQYLLLLASQDTEDKNKNMFFWENPEQFWNNLLILYLNIFEFMPTIACDLLPKIVTATIISINDAEIYQEIKLSTNVKNKLGKFQETLTSYIENLSQAKNSVETEDPPDSFRLLNVYPSVKEITTREVPFIRPIIKNGAYQSVEHYLDVQFRLLKEDFTASLRNGICTYLQREENQEPEKQFDVRIYDKVKFISPFVARDRIASLLQFTTNIDKEEIDESSKRFIYGALLCFTSNNFKEISFGIVIDSDTKFFRKGQIIVDITEGHVDLNKNYMMVVCTVFFEPYYQVLMALKKIHEDNFPFKDYIINVTSNTKPPKYIQENSLAYVMEDRYKFQILSPETWPRPEQVGLNESQFKAFQSALTQEFCIIQGPPGTGKTYTTLRIVEFLLRNKPLLGYTGPIFVICFTNHALDQFLEGILPHTDYLLRVGGQSKSIKMQKYSLNKYRGIIRKIQTRAHKHAYGISSDEDDYDSDEEKYDFSDYRSTRNYGAKVYFHKLHEIQTCQNHLTDIISFNGIIRFDTFINLGIISKISWIGRRSVEEIIEWLMEHDKEIDTEEMEDIFQEEQNKTVDTDIYFKEEDECRKLVDDIFSIDERFAIIPKDYENYINNCEDKIKKLDMRDDLQRQKYQEYKALIKKFTDQLYYLLWRLRQCKTQNEVDTPDMTIPLEEMKPDDRWKLYRYWLHLLRTKLCNEISKMDDDLRSSHRAYQEIAQLRDIYIMQKMHVIGMTTTGAARNQKLLQTLMCPIVIAEEAAEVLESHIVVSLTKHCQHLILIGDHQQLRPNTAQYNLAKKYNLEISLFERMVQNGIHCQQLNIQHRMRPEIAKLIVPAIYPKLENSPTVENFPPVLGVTKSIFFINHSVYEDRVHNNISHKNVYEARYLINLASYLIKQRYPPEEITILATYKEQMYLLLQEKKNLLNLDKVRITVVDNFQGEENRIILLSLVRSNREANIGFLKIENRVCVALSRAKEGFFIIGNMNNLENKSAIWPKIKKALVDQDAIGETLTLQCQIHKTKTIIRTWEDFEKVPEGGCNIPCKTKLNCGHICQLPCHPYDKEHEQYECKEKCTRTCPRGHPCRDLCYVKCTPCIVHLKSKLSCGHIQSIKCFVKPGEYRCKAKVEAILPCGHTGEKRCYENPKDAKCLYPCQTVLDCGHMCKSLCHVTTHSGHTFYECNEPCTNFRKGCSTNEHICPLKCWEECPPCTEIIKKRRITCTHKVRVRCNEEIDETFCREKCRKMLPCGHYCPKLCFQECGNCPVMVMKTIESCGHSITTECRNEVDKTMCNDQCSQLLKCGHPCKNKCNEPCTDDCQVSVTYKNRTTGEMDTNFCFIIPDILE